MSSVTIWHNPRCAKSRQGLALLEEHGIKATVVKYLQETPSVPELKTVLHKLNIPAQGLMRTKEAIYKTLELKGVEDEDVLIQAMAEHPKLIERPIVIMEDQAVIGRPPEKILELISKG